MLLHCTENLRARLSRSAKATYADFCVDFERLYQRHKYGFARVPSPEIGSVDIAELFIERDKFVSTNLYFSKYRQNTSLVQCVIVTYIIQCLINISYPRPYMVLLFCL